MTLLQELTVPQESVNDERLLVVEIPFANGDQVSANDIVVEFETSKTTFTMETEVDGYIQYLAEVGDEVPINEVIIRIYDTADFLTEVPANKPVAEVSGTLSPAIVESNGNGYHPPAETITNFTQIVDNPTSDRTVQEAEDTIFSQKALALMKAHQVDPASFKGKDFVSSMDVQKLINPAPSQKVDSHTPSSSAVSPAAPKPAPIKVDEEKVVLEPLSKVKKIEIEYLSQVQSAGLTSLIQTPVETEGILAHVNPSLKLFKGSFLPLILFETSRLLRKYPVFNAYFAGDAIAIYKDVNIGLAIDLEDKGLKVLKIENTDELNLNQVEDEILGLSDAYLDDKIKPSALMDITFTVTDLSGEGVGSFVPLVNAQNGAILGVSALDPKLQRFNLSLSFDHRITAGRQAAIFLRELKERLESYGSMGNTAD